MRLSKYPLETRIELVRQMDEWQLTHLPPSLVLPLRPGEFAGLLVRDVDSGQKSLKFGTPFGGRDCTKGGVSFTVPFPLELAPLLQFCTGGRANGPLLQSRAVFEGRRRPRPVVTRETGVQHHLDDAFRQAARRDVQAPHDQKRLVPKVLRDMGGVSKTELAREFKRVLQRAGLDESGQFYRLRESATTELEHAGVSHLVQRYVTGHTISDILNTYVCLDPHAEMRKYFNTIQPLISAILNRAAELGLKLPGHDDLDPPTSAPADRTVTG